ncbi:MAG: glycosyltransferase family 2 protein [Patescibacteria group bacterium]
MEYTKTPYFHVGRATDLSGTDYILYRAFEILPGLLSWGTLIGIILLSRYAPVYAALFIIAFDVYWVLKTAFLSAHLRQNYRRMKHNISLDWEKRLLNFKYDHIIHVVILPFYTESKATVEAGIQSILAARGDKKRFAIVLAAEERAGENARRIAEGLERTYKNKFGHFIVTFHPKDIPGEMAGKGSNVSYAAREAQTRILDAYHIPHDNVLVSAFDIDTVVYPDYFLCLTWHFLTVEDPYHASFQPVPLYNNNIWQAPALSRVVANSGTFWQMIQQERPERLATFSSHSIPFKTLNDIGFWQKNMVSEDSRIFWNAFVGFNGDYRVVPLSYPVSMDANLAPRFWETIKNIYKQQRRWTWGVENVPYILFSCVKNPLIPFRKKVKMAFIQIEGFWSLATNPLVIFLLGWLPIYLGGKRFNEMVLAYNLPLITRDLMIIAMLGLFYSAYLSLKFMPPPPPGMKRYRKAFMLLQWVLIPITMTFFGAIPGLDAQTRLMFGRYMGFWVTPKHMLAK